MSDLSGKVIVITGSAGNLGGCMAKLLSARGARLVLSDINKGGVERRRDEIRDQGGQAEAPVTDVTNEGQVRDLMNSAVRELRPEARRVGKECVSTFRYRRSQKRQK